MSIYGLHATRTHLPFGSSDVENRKHCPSRVSTSLDTNGARDSMITKGEQA
ncbi:MAG: hypothetical protein KKD64_07480 [Alphaproteobacteria bacterium]|nr:hypothetical protein [Alphaproteobacteria bacterium]MBU0793736.1 hypothetical protein [Alphaproteobacteria bacterium]MBU0876460.1 hypothetical protein [Alphaproteobacteria bacterium]MBU1769479.1 hypothetical protein [Alphaproteobacteria bacterium]